MRNRKDEKQTNKNDIKTQRDKVKQKERETGTMRKQKDRGTKSIRDRWKERKVKNMLFYQDALFMHAIKQTNGFMAYDCFTN